MRRLLILGLFLLAAGAAYGEGPEDGANQDINEILQQKDREAQAVAPLNAMNPLSESSDWRRFFAFDWLPSDTPYPFFNRIVRRYRNEIGGRALSENVIKIQQHPSAIYALTGSGIWFVLFILIRIWRMSISKKFWSRLYTRAWTFVLSTAGALVVIPVFVLGDPYLALLKSAIYVLSGKRF